MGNAAPTVLVVDDDPELRAFLDLLLSGAGYRVRSAATLTQVDSELTHDRPDVVLTDVSIAGSAPFAVLDQLDDAPRTRTVPVLVCTGAVHLLQADKARLRRPRTAALLKPFDIDVLLECVANLLTPGSPLPAQIWQPTRQG